MSMSCDGINSPVIEAIIENGEVKTTDDIIVPDAVHPYNNTNDGNPTGTGKGLLIQDIDGLIQFIMTNLNSSVIGMMQTMIDNLNFTSAGTDPLALEIETKLTAIRDALKDQIKQVP